MKYCPKENFYQLAEAITRIEQHIGLVSSTDNQTINGRLYNLTNKFYTDPVTKFVYYYDDSRNMWLSVDRELLEFSINAKNINTKRYFKFGGIYTALQGFESDKSFVILSCRLSLKNSASGYVTLLKNGTDVGTFTFTNVSDESFDNLTIQFNPGDELKVYVSPSMSLHYPRLTIQIAYKTNKS